MQKGRFDPTLCVTHNCNLDCVYCYQKHDTLHDMSHDVAFECVDWIFKNIPNEDDQVALSFIGGEPLLRFELIKDIYEYVKSKYSKFDTKFFASTNGTVLTQEMKKWFSDNKNNFILGLSLDGEKSYHDNNRSNSFDKIDFDFFLKNWPYQGVKMTISETSIANLYKNIEFIHSLGFSRIDGVNLAEGEFEWDDDKYIRILIPELEKLVEYYSENIHIELDQTFSKPLGICEIKKGESKKWCGIGENMVFFDTDGTRYPCSFVSPMTFSAEQLKEILATDFSDVDSFVDEYCLKNCYIYPICSTCSASNYMINHSFKERNKRKCKIQKLIALFVAEMHTNRILNHREIYKDETQLYYLIEAIKVIKAEYLPIFENYLKE